MMVLTMQWTRLRWFKIAAGMAFRKGFLGNPVLLEPVNVEL